MSKLGDFFRRKMKMSDDGHINPDEQSAAFQKSWEVFCKNAKELGFDPNDKSIKIEVRRPDKDSDYMSFRLMRGKEEVGEIKVDKFSGDYRLSDENDKKIVETRGYGDNHHPVRSKAPKQEATRSTSYESIDEPKARKVKDLAGTSFGIGEKSGLPADGKYHLVMREMASGTLPAGNGSKMTGGVLALVGPDGRYVAEATYLAGGHKRGAPVFEDGVSQTKILETYHSKKLGVRAFRFDDSAFENNRLGILAHQDLRSAGGSSGCFCPTAKEMNALFAAWDKIPASQRPKYLEHRHDLDISNQAEAMLSARIDKHGAKMAFHGNSNHHTAQVETPKHGQHVSQANLGNMQAPIAYNANQSQTLLGRLFG
jgi:hypothetical protein